MRRDTLIEELIRLDKALSPISANQAVTLEALAKLNTMIKPAAVVVFEGANHWWIGKRQQAGVAA